MPEPIKPARIPGRAKTMTALAAVPPVAPVPAPEAVAAAVQRAATSVASTTETAAPAQPAPETPIQGTETMATAADTVTQNPFTANEAAADKAQAMFGDMQGRAKAAMDKGAKFYEELGDLTKGNVEALMASGRVASSAAESFGQDAAAYGKQSFEKAMATFRSLAAAKSPTELFQLQSDYARTAFDAMVAEGSRVSEKMLKVAGDVAQPISTRFAVAAEKVKSAAL